MQCSKCSTRVLYCPCCGEKLVTAFENTTEDSEITLVGADLQDPHKLEEYLLANPLPPEIFKPSNRKQIAKLVLIDDNKKDPEAFFVEKGSSLVGRPDTARESYPEIDLSFDKSGTISRYHAKIHKKEEGFFLEDLNSGNGTFIFDGKQLEKLLPGQLYLLKNRNRIRFGKVLMQFLVE